MNKDGSHPPCMDLWETKEHASIDLFLQMCDILMRDRGRRRSRRVSAHVSIGGAGMGEPGLTSSLSISMWLVKVSSLGCSSAQPEPHMSTGMCV